MEEHMPGRAFVLVRSALLQHIAGITASVVLDARFRSRGKLQTGGRH
jgi:hypothetical protein